jgi:ubiquinone/menaquinone biosynthesis C-methylase UbiE
LKAKRSHKQDQMAKLYDAEILPIWSQRFGKMLLRELTVPPKAMVLDVLCGTGYPALEVLKRMDDQGRIIAIDPVSPLLDEARTKAGPLSGKRIYFRSEGPEPRLSFADDVYDLVVSNLGLNELDDPQVGAADFARVCKPGGRVIATLPLQGTFGEFYDIFREVLIKRDRAEALGRLDRWLERYPSPDGAERWFRRAGLLDVQVEHEKFTLLFKSSREFFFAPVIEHGPLSSWKEIAGKGAEMQEIFLHVKESIDAYFGTRPFQVTVDAGCVRGRKPLEEERYMLVETPPPETPMPENTTDRRVKIVAPDDDEPPTGEISLHTGEIVVMDRDGDDRDEDDEERPIPDDQRDREDDDL